MEMFISMASFILSSGYLCVMRSVIGRPRSWASFRKSKLCTQSLAWYVQEPTALTCLLHMSRCP